MLRVEVVVDGEAADFEAVSDVLDGFAQCESSERIKAANDVLFSGSIEARDGGAEFSLDLVDQAIECSLEAGRPKASDHVAVPSQWEIAIGELSGGDDLAPESERQWLHGLDELLHGVKLAHQQGHPTRLPVMHSPQAEVTIT